MLTCCFEPGSILCQLVEHNQYLATAKDALEIRPARGRMRGHFLLHLAVEFLATNLESYLTPECIGDECLTPWLMDRDLVASYSYNNHLTRGREESRIENRTSYLRQLSAPEAKVCASDQRMGLAASKSGLEPVDGGKAVITCQTPEDVREDTFHPLRWIGRLREKRFRIRIDILRNVGVT